APGDPARVAVLPGCSAPLPVGGRCPRAAECYGEVTEAGGVPDAPPVPCGRRHTWEVYALGELPAGAGAADLPGIDAHRGVRRLCNEGTFRVVSWRLDDGWTFTVLPPRPAALADGDRAYRCLAGRGTDALVGPTLAR
ncbi:MAG TPA: serine/threonine protein kinase, partial [Pilimelia sp.]|nr:serine/threonine protein kinase [Pilimelia sp.]